MRDVTLSEKESKHLKSKGVLQIKTSDGTFVLSYKKGVGVKIKKSNDPNFPVGQQLYMTVVDDETARLNGYKV